MAGAWKAHTYIVVQNCWRQQGRAFFPPRGIVSFTSSQGWSQANSRVPPKRNNIFIPEHSTSWWQLWDIFVFNLRYLWVHDPIRRAYFSDNGWNHQLVNLWMTSIQADLARQISTYIFLVVFSKKLVGMCHPETLGGSWSNWTCAIFFSDGWKILTKPDQLFPFGRYELLSHVLLETSIATNVRSCFAAGTGAVGSEQRNCMIRLKSTF